MKPSDMLSRKSEMKVKRILANLALGSRVSFEERVFLQRMADKDQTISCWVKQAKRIQSKQQSSDAIDHLVTSLDLCADDQESSFNPQIDDLGEWFMGAPSWVSRS